ncbi:MAG: M56 family metallopeptidase [Chloroflexota bacterium]
MSRADRAFGSLVVIAGGVGAWLAVPVLLTLFPAAIERLVRGSGDAVAFCTGVLTSVHPELPPLGLAALALTGVLLAPATLGALRGSRKPRPYSRPGPVASPRRLKKAAARVGLASGVICLDDGRRYAYCAGLLSPSIYVSAGAVRALRADELEAVLWHEAYHLRRRDPLRAVVADRLALVFMVVPVIRALVARFEVARELEADRAALRAQGTARSLAGALLTLGRELPPVSGAAISAWSLSSARVDQLFGTSDDQLIPPIPGRALLLSGGVLALAVALTFGQAARAHLLPLALLPEAPGAVAHICPLPIQGPLL